MKKDKKISINLYICFIALIIIIGLVFTIYYFTMFQTKRINIDFSNISELNETVVIDQLQTGDIFSKIQLRVTKNEDNLKDYMNFANGPGTGYYLNYNIVVEKNNKQYKIKTILKENTDNEIVLEGYVNNNFLDEEYKIGLLQQDFNKETQEDVFRYSIIK